MKSETAIFTRFSFLDFVLIYIGLEIYESDSNG